MDAEGVAVAGATLFWTIITSGERAAVGDEEDFAVNEALVDAFEDVGEFDDSIENDFVDTAGMAEVCARMLLAEAVSCNVAAFTFP